ncbi:MAG: DinB family protein [Cytophagales bacterium]
MSNKKLCDEARNVLIKLIESIEKLTFDEYTEKISVLSNSSIGEHTRHIIELFQQLLEGVSKSTNIVNYDNRNRNLTLQQNIDFAIESIAKIIYALNKQNQSLQIETLHGESNFLIESNFERELLYNIEHCIHHQAMIKVGLIALGKGESIDPNFGVAKSTLIFRETCVQ